MIVTSGITETRRGSESEAHREMGVGALQRGCFAGPKSTTALQTSAHTRDHSSLLSLASLPPASSLPFLSLLFPLPITLSPRLLPHFLSISCRNWKNRISEAGASLREDTSPTNSFNLSGSVPSLIPHPHASWLVSGGLGELGGKNLPLTFCLEKVEVQLHLPQNLNGGGGW